MDRQSQALDSLRVVLFRAAATAATTDGMRRIALVEALR